MQSRQTLRQGLPRPSELRTVRGFEDTVAVTQAMDRIKKALQKWDSKPVGVSFPYDTPQRVQDAINKECRASGWATSCEYHNNYDPRDPREADYYILTLTANE